MTSFVVTSLILHTYLTGGARDFQRTNFVSELDVASFELQYTVSSQDGHIYDYGEGNTIHLN